MFSLKSEKGFGLVEVMVSGAILSIIMLSVGKALIGLSSTVSRLEDRQSKVMLASTINSLVDTENICISTLGNRNVDQILTDLTLVDDAGTPLLQNGNQFDYLNVTDVQLHPEQPGVPPTPNTVSIMKLVFMVESRRNARLNFRPIEKNLVVQVDAARNIVGCRPEYLTANDIAGLARLDELNQLRDQLENGRSCQRTSAFFGERHYSEGATIRADRFYSYLGDDSDSDGQTKMLCINGRWVEV